MCGFNQQSVGESLQIQFSNFGTRNFPGFETHGMPRFWTKSVAALHLIHYSFTRQSISAKVTWKLLLTSKFSRLIWYLYPRLDIYVFVYMHLRFPSDSSSSEGDISANNLSPGCCDVFTPDCRLRELWRIVIYTRLTVDLTISTDSFMILLINAYCLSSHFYSCPHFPQNSGWLYIHHFC